jgi:hypothetical protein
VSQTVADLRFKMPYVGGHFGTLYDVAEIIYTVEKKKQFFKPLLKNKKVNSKVVPVN